MLLDLIHHLIGNQELEELHTTNEKKNLLNF